MKMEKDDKIEKTDLINQLKPIKYVNKSVIVEINSIEVDLNDPPKIYAIPLYQLQQQLDCVVARGQLEQVH